MSEQTEIDRIGRVLEEFFNAMEDSCMPETQPIPQKPPKR